MLGVGVVDKKQLPGKMPLKSVSQPISIPVRREYLYNNKSNPSSLPSTPPNDFMNHLQKRLYQFATSPVLIYNLRN